MNKLLVVSISIMGLMLFIIVGCSTPEKASPTPPTPAKEAAPLARAGWEQKWDMVLSEAKREKQVIIWGTDSTWAGARAVVVEAFEKKYGIEAAFTIINSNMMAEKMFRERKAGINNVDIILTGPTTGYLLFKPAEILDQLEPTLILPEVLSPGAWFGGKLNWLDPEHTLLGMGVSLQPKIAFNTNMVKQEEIRNIKELLNPKWKGKIVMPDPTRPGPANIGIKGLGSGPFGWDFIRGLVNQEPVIIADSRLQLEWVARERYPVALFVAMGIVQDFQKANAPVKVIVPSDDLFMNAAGTYIAQIKNAPHPAAASLFTNWFLTREGQMTYVAPSQTASARLDVPNRELLDVAIVPDPSIKYRNNDTPEWISKDGSEYQQKLMDIFIPYLRK